MKILITLALACLLATAPTAVAMTASDILPDPMQEARARTLTHRIRCPVCAGEALDESNAALARDLRRLVRERIAAGDSDEDIFRFLQERYGDGILMRPPIDARTIMLWLLPLTVAGTGLYSFWRLCRACKNGEGAKE
ncbi:MAG: cytochrome c-type biogenesis protein CcmH [Bdellovibrionales bacterium]